MIPQPMIYPPVRQPQVGLLLSEQDMAWTACQYGQSQDVQDPSPPFPGYVPELSVAHQPQHNAWEGTYAFQQVGPACVPFQSVVEPEQWGVPSLHGFIGDNTGGVHHLQAQYPSPQYGGPLLPHGPPYSHVPSQHSGALQNHWGQPQHRGQFQHRGQIHHRGQLQPRGQPQRRMPTQHRGRLQFRGLSFPHGHQQFRHQLSSPPPMASVPQVVPPDPEKTPTPEAPRPKSKQANKENPTRPVHAWNDVSECPQPSGMYSPPPLPPIDLDLIVEVGDTVRVKPWADQYTWIEGRVEKADFSIIKNHKPSPRYVVSYRDPASKHLRQRTFCPHLSEIMIKESDEPGMRPLPEGIDRSVYACIPPPIIKSKSPVEMIWTHALALTPPDENNRINIRILIGPSQNFLFNDFPLKYTLPFCRASRTRVAKLGYSVSGNDEHPIEDLKL
ncbi:hypothetical protein C8R44DRAFT_30429 [Mycena epipterygia]|nr:hypothetical protein C8R44DRAFT_30429 [Mycena epipterygia]